MPDLYPRNGFSENTGQPHAWIKKKLDGPLAQAALTSPCAVKQLRLWHLVIFTAGAAIWTSIGDDLAMQAFIGAAEPFISAILSVLQLVVACISWLHSRRAHKKPHIIAVAMATTRHACGNCCDEQLLVGSGVVKL